MARYVTKKRKKTVGDLASTETAMEFLYAGVGAMLYTGLPTALNMNGAGAMAVAIAPSIALGLWRKSYAFLAGSMFVGLVHVIYKYGSNWTLNWWGRPIWSLDPTMQAPPADLKDYFHYDDMHGMHDAVQLPNGYSALALPPGDMPGNGTASGMNDYITAQNQLLDDDDGSFSSVRYEQNGSFESPSIFE